MRLAPGCFLAQVEVGDFVRREEGNDPIQASLPPCLDLVCKPIAPAWARHNGQAPRPGALYPIHVRFHDLLPFCQRALLGEDVSGEGININTTIIQYFEAVMTIDYRPVWSDFQRAGLPWLQRVDAFLG
jgi:hypothetical protein